MDEGAPSPSDGKLNESYSEKPPVYPNPTPDTLLVDTRSPLEQKIGLGRRKVNEVYHKAHSQVQSVVSKWIGVEHAIESRVKSIISLQENLTPGILYVGVATLTGSIIARNRRLPTRLLLPPALFYLSLNHFLPLTTLNLKSYFSHLEHKHFPKFAEKHDIANAHTTMAWSMIKEKVNEGRERTQGGAQAVVDKVQKATGLKLREVFRLEKLDRNEVLEKIEAKTADVLSTVEEKAGAFKDVVEKKLEDVKDKAQKKAEAQSSSETKA